MRDFSPDEARRGYAWQHANPVSADRTDMAAKLLGVILLCATLVALRLAVWR